MSAEYVLMTQKTLQDEATEFFDPNKLATDGTKSLGPTAFAVSMYIYIHTHTCMYIHIHIHVYVYIMCMYFRMCVCKCIVCVYVNIALCNYVHMHTYTFAHAWKLVCSAYDTPHHGKLSVLHMARPTMENCLFCI